jgi:hypothetical protein
MIGPNQPNTENNAPRAEGPDALRSLAKLMREHGDLAYQHRAATRALQ